MSPRGRKFPGTPPHDGIRLFLPAFAFLAAIIGIVDSVHVDHKCVYAKEGSGTH